MGGGDDTSDESSDADPEMMEPLHDSFGSPPILPDSDDGDSGLGNAPASASVPAAPLRSGKSLVGESSSDEGEAGSDAGLASVSRHGAVTQPDWGKPSGA